MGDFRVLLVDDEEELASTLAERLQLRGIDAEAVTRGEDALTRMEEAPFEVVLLDVKMPGLGGLELLEMLRLRHPGTKVILITGHLSADGAQGGLPEGAFDYVVKPVDIEVLVHKMREAAARARSGARP